MFDRFIVTEMLLHYSPIFMSWDMTIIWIKDLFLEFTYHVGEDFLYFILRMIASYRRGIAEKYF